MAVRYTRCGNAYVSFAIQINLETIKTSSFEWTKPTWTCRTLTGLPRRCYLRAQESLFLLSPLLTLLVRVCRAAHRALNRSVCADTCCCCSPLRLWGSKCDTLIKPKWPG